MEPLDFKSIKSSEMKPNEERAKRAMYVFIAIAGFNVIALLSGYLELDLLERIQSNGVYTEEEANASDLRQSVIGLIQITLYITSVFLFLYWFRRAYANLKKIGINLKHDDNMTIWSFIIPIISLYRPFQIACEIAEKTEIKIREVDNRYRAAADSTILIVWWILYLIKTFLGQISFRMTLKEETLDQMITGRYVLLIGDFVDIIAAIATFYFIKQLSKDETKLNATMEESLIRNRNNSDDSYLSESQEI